MKRNQCGTGFDGKRMGPFFLKRWLVAMAVIVVGAMAISACGGGSRSTSSGGGNASSNYGKNDASSSTEAQQQDAAAEPAPAPEQDPAAAAEPAPAPEPVPEPAPEEPANEGGLRPDFKAAMDSYETFMDEYVAFMKKYNENPSDLELMSEYADYMVKCADCVNKFEKWDSEGMNGEELAYYTEVQARVMKKLLEVGE